MYQRTAVTFNIPSSVDYKFFEINDFKGLHITDNPFTAPAGSASDMLNVYRDNYNKLVTRPRLNYNFTKDKTIIDTQLLDSTMYVLYYTDITPAELGLCEINMISHVIKEITPDANYTIVGNKLNGFIKDNVTYFFDLLMDSNSSRHMGYVYTSGSTLKIGKYVDYYIPLYRVKNTETSVGDRFEELNIFSNKYRESWAWDGIWSIVDTGITHSLPDKGTFLSQSVLDKSGIIKTPLDSKEIVKITEYGVLVNAGYQNIDGVGNRYLFNLYDFNNNLIKEIIMPQGFSLSDPYQFSDDYETLACVDTNEIHFPDASRVVLYVYYKGATYSRTLSYPDSGMTETSYTFDLKISKDGSLVALTSKWSWLLNGNSSEGSALTRAVRNSLGTTYTMYSQESASSATYGSNFISETGEVGIVFNITMAGTPKISYNMKASSPTLTAYSEFPSVDAVYNVEFNNNIMIYCYRIGSVYYNKFFRNIATSRVSEDLLTPTEQLLNIKISDSAIWYMYEDLLVRIYYDEHKVVSSQFKTPYSYSYEKVCWASDTEYIIKHYLVSDNDSYISFSAKIDDPFQEIIYEKTIGTNDRDYDVWNTLNSMKKHCDFFTNFKNSYWLGYGKYVFASDPNNPFYFKISQYNEFPQIINGFNRLTDNVMAVYSEKQIYLQQPIDQDDGSYILTSTETMSLNGNVAKAQTITAAHSNIPIHIGSKGIYALQLEENVQSSERLSVLISENINKKLLTEDLPLCKTFDAGFYTYFIFRPDNFVNSTHSHVYVLDNRTLQWYYWEFPIVICNMHEYEESLILVEQDGRIYTLENEDEFDDITLEEPTTIYADEISEGVMTTIPWVWRSQLLWFNTTNYKKQLLTTSFIVLDDDSIDNYGLSYKFLIYRKYYKTDSEDYLLEGDLNYVKTVTARTRVSGFNYIQLEISNPKDDSVNNYNEYDSNKLSLVSIMFKYRLLPGGI